jgi:hypothetical protein
MSSPVSALFQPLRVGAMNLQHRVVMAPLTRFRANKDYIHGELAKTYYSQRSSVPGTLIITEGTFIAPQAAGYTNIPGIWTDAQITGWKEVSRPPRIIITIVVRVLTFRRLRMPYTQMARLYSYSSRRSVVLQTLPS